MDHKTFLAQMPPDHRQALNDASAYWGYLHLAGHCAAILVLATYVALALPFWGIAEVLLGISLIFLFTLEHECTHQTPFPNKWMNEVVGHICGALILVPFTRFRAFHMAHHRFTNDPARDPELAAGSPQNHGGLFKQLSGLPFWAGSLRELLNAARNPDPAIYIPTRLRPRVSFEARILLGIYALAILSLFYTPLLFWLWFLPVVLGQPFLRFYLMAEHGFCDNSRNMFANTRTILTHPLVRFFAWNMPYHAEHHTMPQVPYYRLGRLHRDIKTYVKHTANGYGRFAWDVLKRRSP